MCAGLSANSTQKVSPATLPSPQKVAAPAAVVVGQGQQKWASAGANLIGNGQSQSQQQQQQQQHLLHTQLAEQWVEECHTVTALDTPCQRAAVRAHKAAVESSEHALAAHVCMLKTVVYKWARQEQQWGDAWQQMVNELDCV
jgi:hypothetical protein